MHNAILKAKSYRSLVRMSQKYTDFKQIVHHDIGYAFLRNLALRDLSKLSKCISLGKTITRFTGTINQLLISYQDHTLRTI